MTTHNIQLIVLRALMLGVCLWAITCFAQVHAQEDQQQQQQRMMTATDAVQNRDIAEINDHLRSTDTNVEKQRVSIEANALAIGAVQEDQRIFTVLIGLITSVSIFVQVKTKSTPKGSSSS